MRTRRSLSRRAGAGARRKAGKCTDGNGGRGRERRRREHATASILGRRGSDETMRKWKTLFRMLVMASEAHARWEVEISSNILKDKRRMWLLGFLGGAAGC